jgi:hypothetical protein
MDKLAEVTGKIILKITLEPTVDAAGDSVDGLKVLAFDRDLIVRNVVSKVWAVRELCVGNLVLYVGHPLTRDTRKPTFCLQCCAKFNVEEEWMYGLHSKTLGWLHESRTLDSFNLKNAECSLRKKTADFADVPARRLAYAGEEKVWTDNGRNFSCSIDLYG